MPRPFTAIPLPENAGLAFRGEAAWQPAALTGREAAALRRARNPTGRPNIDVMRQFVGFAGGRVTRGWRLDFPLHGTAQEAALYAAPFALLRGPAKARPGFWWINPYANTGLRTAIGRLGRYLAMPVTAREPAWEWIDGGSLPDDSLLAVARDDDFARGVLGSRAFSLWWQGARHDPVRMIESFPFPWPPRTLLGSLTREQEEHRHVIARAARSEDAGMLHGAVSAAYGWPVDRADSELLARLRNLSARRAG